MYELFPEIFEENNDERFTHGFYDTLAHDLNWPHEDSTALIYMSDINSSTDSLPFQASFRISTFFPSPMLSVSYSRSGSQSSVEVFRPELVDATCSPTRIYNTTETNKKSAVYECTFPGCSKKFTRRDNIKYHLKTHELHRDRPFACTQCEKCYFRAIDLTRHIRVTHEKIKAYKCRVCSQSYTRKEALKRHTEKNHC